MLLYYFALSVAFYFANIVGKGCIYTTESGVNNPSTQWVKVDKRFNGEGLHDVKGKYEQSEYRSDSGARSSVKEC